MDNMTGKPNRVTAERASKEIIVMVHGTTRLSFVRKTVFALILAQLASLGRSQTTVPPPDPALLSTVSSVFNLTQSKSPVSIAPDGSLCLCVTGKDIVLPDRASIILVPELPSTRFEHARSILTVNRKVIEEKSTLSQSNPSFRVDMNDGSLVLKRISVIGEDTFRKQIELLGCTMRRSNGQNAPIASLQVKDGKVRLATTGPKPKAVYLFLGNDFAGAIEGDPSAFSVDVRTVPPGRYPLRSVAESEDGSLTLPTMCPLAVPSRFHVTSTATNESFGVEKETVTLPAHIERTPESEVVKVQVLLDNKTVVESADPSFDVKLNMTNIPSGAAELTLVGKDKDGKELPPETFELKVQNYFLNTSGITQSLQDDLKRIAELGQQIEYYYTKAINERDTVTETRTATTGTSYSSSGFAEFASTRILNQITITPGKQAEYLATCRKYIVERAQVRLRVAQEYKQMGRMQAFRKSCLRIVREAGPESGLAKAAMQLLNEG